MFSLLCRRPPLVGAAVLVLSAALLVTAGLARAQTPPSPGSARGLTQSLVALDAQYRGAGPAKRAQLVSRLLSVAATRQQVLLSLVESDPGEVLRVALPANLRAGMASSVQRYLEKEVDLDGVLEVLHEDWPTGGRYHYFLHSASGRYSLHFANSQPTHLLTGARIRVTGVQVGTMLALAGSTSVQTLAPAPVPNTFGAKSTVVLLVNFQDNPIQPYTLDYARSFVFTTTSNFFLENSFHQTWLTGNVYGWYTIPLNSTVCDGLAIRDYAKAAATAAGVDLSPYATFVYAFPWNSGCGWSGLAQLGGPSVWINGYLEVQMVGLPVLTHELGHVLGLYHSHSLECGATTLGTNCSTWEYGDTLDAMGNHAAAHFNAFQKERLGWLNYGGSPPVTTVQAPGTYTLEAYELAGVSSKALKILKSTDPTTGTRTWYYVEFRQALGFDGFLAANPNVLNGVVVHTGSEADPNSSNLLDMTPASSSLNDVDWNDPALVVGESFSDPGAGVTITPVSVSSTAAAVAVNVGPSACTHANPTVALSPSQSQWVLAGTPVTYTVSVTDNDSAGCAASNFTLAVAAPAGWAAASANPTLTLSPGASGSTTLTVSSPTTATDGFYTIDVTATSTANTASTAAVSATYVIFSSLSVTVSTDKASYTRNQTGTATAIVSAGGSPVASASIVFTITKSNGSVVTGTVATDTNGAAVFKFRIKQQDPVGVYQARAVAKTNNLSGSAAKSFTVQ